MEEIKKGLIISCFAIISLLSINVAYAQYGGGGYAGDYSAPMISNINVAVTGTGATITWLTNESSISWVVYGTSTAYGLETKTTSYISSHSVTLSNLSPSTLYHYSVKSKDSSGNIGSYTDKTFTTLALGEQPKVEETPPVIVKPVSEMTIAELRTEINRLIALISQLQAQLGKPKIGEIPAGFNFEKNLSLGMTDPNVVNLKIVLAGEGCLTDVKNTEYFASKTLAGVKCLCQKYKEEISQFAGYEVQCSGFVGKGIIAKLNQLIK